MYKIEQQIKRKTKTSTKALKILMIIFAILFLVMGIMLQTGYMMFCFVFAGLYFVFEANADREYEYIYTDDVFKITVIKAKRRRQLVHELNMSKLEIVAPHNSEKVDAYRRGSGNSIPKYDYTSYEHDNYYTMIIAENDQKIKLLLDLNDEMLDQMKRKYPSKIFK